MAHVRSRGKKPDRYWIIVYLRGKYERYEFNGTYAAAKKQAIRLEARKLNGTLEKPARLTVSQWLARYTAQKGDLAEGSQEVYRRYAARLGRVIGHIKLKDLVVDDVRGFVGAAFANGNSLTGAGLSAKSVRESLAFLNAALRAAELEQLIVPGARLQLARGKGGAKAATKVLVHDEAQHWLRLTARSRIGLAVWIALLTGLRNGELLALRRCDVDLDAGLLYVRQKLRWSNGVPIFEEPKTPNSLRSIDLPDCLIEELRHHFEKQDVALPPRQYRLDERLVWAHPDGRPLRRDSLSRIPAMVAQRYGTRVVRFHDLRHTYATLLLESGVSMKTVSLLLGHADVTITIRLYGHVTPRSRRDVRDVLDRLAGGETFQPAA